jgi:tRNA G46 methylase TrmB
MSEGDAAVGLSNVLRSGVLNDTWPGARHLLEHSTTKTWFTAIDALLDKSSPFLFIELGCFSERSLLSASVANAFPRATVLALHVCNKQRGDVGALLRTVDELNLENLFVAERPLAASMLEDLRGAQQAHHHSHCDLGVVSDLSSTAAAGNLPYETEALVAGVLTLCSQTVLPPDLPNERPFSFWSSIDELTSHAARRLPAYHVTVKNGAKAGHYHTSSTGTTSTTYSATTTSAYSSPYKTTISSSASYRVVSTSIRGVNASGSAQSVSVLSVPFLLAAGLVAPQRFALLRRLVARVDSEKDAAPVVFGSSLVTHTQAANLSALATPFPGQTWTPAPNVTSSSSRRQLLGLLWKDRPMLEPATPDAEEDVHSDDNKGRRVGSFLTADQEAEQSALAAAEEPPMLATWPGLETELETMAFSSVLVLGSEMGLVGTKVSAAHPLSTVVSVRTAMSHTSAHLRLLELMRVRNHLHCVSDLKPATLAALLAPGDPFDVAVLGGSILTQLMMHSHDEEDGSCDWNAFEVMLGASLNTAVTSFLVLPKLRSLASALDLVLPHCAQSFRERYMTPPSEQGDGTEGLSTAETSSPEGRLLARALTSVGSGAVRARRIRYGAKDTSLLLRVERVSGVASVQSGVSLYALLHLGIVPALKAELFRSFLALPLFRFGSLPALVPWKIRFNAKDALARLSVYVAPGASEYKGVQGRELFSSIGRTSAAAERDAAAAKWATMRGELEQQPAEHQNGDFSLLEYGSGRGALSMAIAARYPNATVLSLEAQGNLAEGHLETLTQRNLANNIVANPAEDYTAIADKFSASPEFFRYLIYSPSLLDLADSKTLASLFTTALTSFYALPSDKHLSLALSIFYPLGTGSADSHSGTLLGPTYAPDKSSAEAAYSLISHPMKPYLDLDLALLRRLSEKATLSVAVRRLAPPLGVAGLPLLRLDIVNMTRHVHHHFDYIKDGHTRTYTMTVAVNATATADAEAVLRAPLAPSEHRSLSNQVGFWAAPLKNVADNGARFLTSAANSGGVRGGSGVKSWSVPLGHHLNGGSLVSVSMLRDKSTHVIPYNTIKSVTLIAVLRLGLLKGLKERAYRLFVKLPLFEDMAPWNIVFEGAQLKYIDYDTRDKTFDSEVVRTYQVLSALMNYKRTVSDFSKCGSKVGNPYNFPFLSECVKSSAFSGPCEDPAAPVPCGDGQCHSDYISCLRAVVEGDEATEARRPSAPIEAAAPSQGRLIWDLGST